MTVSDQPGRLFAILVFAPFLIFRGISYQDALLTILGIALFFYEIFWIITAPPQHATLPFSNSAEN